MTTQNIVNTTLSGQTGTGNFVGANTPTLITPVLGAATATSINFGGASLSTYSGLTSWTPVFTFATPGNLSVVYSTQAGQYSRIGNIVIANFAISFTPTFTTSSGIAAVTGLPFTSNSASGNIANGSAFISGNISFPAGQTYVITQVGAGGNTISFPTLGTVSNAGSLSTANFTTTLAATIYGTIIYMV